MSEWGRSPKFLLRADAIRQLTRDCAPGSFLEVGAGAGEMTLQFLQRGFEGKLYDLGEQTRAQLRKRFADDRQKIEVIESLDAVSDGSVDYVFAFEVLEHIAEDGNALAEWRRKIRPGGGLVLSVPAHQSKFGRTDLRVGHVRRYDRAQLLKVTSAARFVDQQLICYGFPLGNLGRILGNLLERVDRTPASDDPVQRSIASGIEQPQVVITLGALLEKGMLLPFLWLQRLTFSTDFGDGYVLHARVPAV